MKKLLFGMLACAAIFACTNEGTEGPGKGPDVFEGEAAFMSIKLNTPSDLPGSKASEGVFEDGIDPDEHDVKTAHFYFYDQAGVFVTQATIWTGGNVETPDNDNIEFKGNITVVLDNLKGNNFPNYLVTVLNKKDDFAPGATLEEMSKKLADEAGEGISYQKDQSGHKYFTMSTSSNRSYEGAPYPFVTPLKAVNFANSVEEVLNEKVAPVEVYVERLAVKVRLSVTAESETIGGKTMYPVHVTVAGEDNGQVDNSVAGTELYVNILGWKLDATAKRSNMVKELKGDWTGDVPFKNWNAVGYYRTYWGASYNYGLDNEAAYPLTSADIKPENYLKYVTISDVNQLGAVEYCAENTNNVSVLIKDDHFRASAVTSVLVKAEVCDAEGKALDMVKYNGLMFKKEQFFNYVLAANSASVKSIFKKVSDTEYSSLSAADVEIKRNDNGKFVLEIVTTETLYSKNAETKEYEAISEVDLAKINAQLSAAEYDAVVYKGGLMYYTIPIEHFGEGKLQYSEDGKASLPGEGIYGVVRNHIYDVKIDNIANLGKGVFDPEKDVIVPEEDTEKSYYLGARINILSWKVVNQNVSL